MLGGDIELKDEAVIGRMLTLGGSFSRRSVAETHEGITARSAAAKGEKAEKTALQMAGADYALYNETAGGRQIDCFLDGEMILALPQEAAPGDTLRLCVEGAEDTLLTLDGQRHARAEVEQVEPGRYECMPKDETRAHLYLYDEAGAFMKEVFYSGGSYSTGALEAGSYQALWIRAGVGGWKLPQLADFEQNGLREGEHYLLEQLAIEPGVIARSKLDIPEEPALQSPWLDAGGTGYQAAVGAVVEDALAMMSLSWRISDPDTGRAAAKIDFLPGSRYVEGSAAVDGQAVDAQWDGQTLYVPLEAQDIGGDIPLTRFTLAEPVLQEADTGFGPGWLTQYHTYAHLEQEGETQLLTVWSPEATRWFAGENGKLEEIGGYATARISKGAATVTEADGGVLAFTAAGRLAQMKDSYGKTLTPVFDGDGRLSAVRTKGAELTLTYGADGHISRAECGGRLRLLRA